MDLNYKSATYVDSNCKNESKFFLISTKYKKNLDNLKNEMTILSGNANLYMKYFARKKGRAPKTSSSRTSTTKTSTSKTSTVNNIDCQNHRVPK